MQVSSGQRRTALLAACFGLIPVAARATDFTWLPFAGGTYAWTDAANWNPTGSPATEVDTGWIVGAATGPLTINLTGTTSIGTMTLGSTSAFPLEIAAAGGTLLYGGATGGRIISVGAAPSLISAPISLANTLTIDATSTTNITFNGPIDQSGGNRSIVNNLPAANRLTLSGLVTLTETGSTTARVFNVTGSGTTLVTGTFTNGVATLNGGVSIGGTNAGSPRPTVIINTPQSHSGATTLNRGTLVIGTAGIFGSGTFSFGGQSAWFARNVVSTSDALDITSPVSLANHITVTGAHSLAFSGQFVQTNSRFVVNNLPAEKVLTINSATIALANSFDNRTMTFDGSGNTVVNGPIYNTIVAGGDPDVIGSIAKHGTGVVTLNSGSSTYRGGIIVNGGILQLANLAASANSATLLVNAGGAVGLLSGTMDPAFLAKLSAGTQTSRGALALAASDSAAAIDFTSGPLAASQTVEMSVGALAGGASYTGTITPDPVQGYRLGGGGTLTLPNANQLTGTRNVTVANGGTVVLGAANDYAGSTSITGHWIIPTQRQAELDGQTALDQTAAALRVNSTLAIADATALGGSADDAANLVFNGGTLRYTGAGGTSNRLFTIHPNGATLDASGAGALVFSNPAAIAGADAPDGSGSIAISSVISGVNDTSRLTLGMTVTGPNIPAGATIIALTPNQIRLSAAGTAALASASISFGTQNRNLNLTGTNTGNNTFAPQLVDSAAGRVGVNKSGSGTWVLTNGNHTYTGGTTVNGGVLATVKVRNNGPTTITGGTLKTANGLAVADPAGTSVFPEGQFTIAGGASPAGKLDLSKGGAVFEYSTVSVASTVSALLDSGYGSGNWDGNGIVSSDAAASPSTHAVGWAESSALGSPATFLGQAVDSTSVLVRYTRQGDANLDGTTGLADFSLVGANYNQPGTWNTGDFNYDGLTGLGDFSLLAANYNQSAGSGVSGRPGAVPEPATLGLLAAAAILGLRRRACRYGPGY